MGQYETPLESATFVQFLMTFDIIINFCAEGV